ncbi:MAG: hypothetical protein KA436_05820 [Oligoflexales bacterium]|nr:hypothetical protein [Oligoflexales bacterium]
MVRANGEASYVEGLSELLRTHADALIQVEEGLKTENPAQADLEVSPATVRVASLESLAVGTLRRPVFVFLPKVEPLAEVRDLSQHKRKNKN